MPLPGPESDKFGNRYEGRWTVYCMIDIMDERAESIRLEPAGEEGEGVEFWLQRTGRLEYFQVKRQKTDQGRWTLAELNSRRVLRHFFNKLSSRTDASCVFVSIDRAFQLDELSDRAKRASGLEEFQQAYLNTDAHKKNFSNLIFYWNNCSPNETFQALRRIRVELPVKKS